MSEISSISSQATPQSTYSDAPAQKNEEIKVFNFGGDKNTNGIVDQGDFNDNETFQLFQEKGLIGKAWDAIKQNVGKIFDLKNASVSFENYVAGERLAPDTYEFDNNGRLSSYSQLYNSTYAPTGEIYLAGKKYVYDKYDEKGNPISAKQYMINKHGENLYGDIEITNEYDSQDNLIAQRNLFQSKTYQKPCSTSYIYDNNGNLTDVYIDNSFGKPQRNHNSYEYDETGKVINQSIELQYDVDNDGIFEETSHIKSESYNYNQDDNASVVLDSSEIVEKGDYDDDSHADGVRITRKKYKT